MRFYGRTTQRKQMHKMIDSQEMQTLLIYGRRRVGKSELIKQVLRETDNTSVYYECKETTELNNTESLASVISEVFGYPRLSFSGIEEILEYLFKASIDKNIILVIDEYPYLRKTVKGLDSIIQSLIDKYRNTARLKLVICGSYVDVMKSLILSESPLYGRIDLTIDLKPMDYLESALFYPAFSSEDKVRIYSVFGGIPYYNKLIDDSKSVRENIIELIASPGSRLENEVSMYLKSEISKIGNANEVFETLAKGFSRFSDILSQSHVSSSPTLVDVLDKLMKMDLVKKTVPINDENNRKKAGYFISDPLSLFYFRYCFRYSSQLSIMDPDVFYERYIEKDFESWYAPNAFEEICRQFLINQNRLGTLPEPFEKIGKYWYDDPINKTNGEFDLVTQDPNGYIFYEVKFRKEPVDRKTIDEEIEQVKRTGLNCYQYWFFSRSGFEVSDASDLVLVDIDDIYR